MVSSKYKQKLKTTAVAPCKSKPSMPPPGAPPPAWPPETVPFRVYIQYLNADDELITIDRSGSANLDGMSHYHWEDYINEPQGDLAFYYFPETNELEWDGNFYPPDADVFFTFQNIPCESPPPHDYYRTEPTTKTDDIQTCTISWTF